MTRAVTSLRVQVMAWELLTGVNLFGNKPSMRDAVDVLSGLRPLPTEMPLTAQARTGLPLPPPTGSKSTRAGLAVREKPEKGKSI